MVFLIVAEFAIIDVLVNECWKNYHTS
ncbi:hypothetical protein [Escherichia phage IMM-001]|nr:hypothetical protein [Escherichia phage IMM-001]